MCIALHPYLIGAAHRIKYPEQGRISRGEDFQNILATGSYAIMLDANGAKIGGMLTHAAYFRLQMTLRGYRAPRLFSQ